MDEPLRPDALPIISRTALSLRNGSDRPEVWVAFRGIVYDASGSRLWRGGLHYGLHWAGQDLTKELEDAPHNELVFSRLPVVGRLNEEE
ncbi:MAG: cytochrome b5 [Bacteroidetes bacterium]|nr:cytochrome b5 [Bacteroidota bacterium]